MSVKNGTEMMIITRYLYPFLWEVFRISVYSFIIIVFLKIVE